jgi:PmbA protein
LTSELLEAKRKSILDSIQASIESAKKISINEVEIFAGYGQGGSVGIEKNDIQSFETYEETVYGIRVIESGCEGFVTTNDGSSLLTSIQEASALAKAQSTPDPDLELPSKPNIITASLDHLDPSLYDLDPNSILETAKKILQYRELKFPKVSLDSAGASLSYSLKAIGTSKGIFRSEASSSLSASFMGMAIDGDDISSFDSESAFGRTPSEFEENFEEKYNLFLQSCMNGLGARTISSFKGYLYLPPDAIFSFLIGGFLSSLSATSIRKKKSKMEGRLNEQVLSDKITILSDPTNPELASCTSFDREGMNTEKMSIVEKGVLKNFFYNHFEAKKAGLQKSNGCATGGSGSTPGCGPKALQVEAGETEVKSMIHPDGKSIWVNRFSGNSSGTSGDFSGVIKGGFLLDAGEKIPVKEIQIAGNMYEVLKNQIAAVSLERELLGKSTWAPSLLIEGIDITGTSV